MPRRYKVLLALAGAALCAVLIGSLSREPGVFGKTYEGHTLEYWTRQVYRGDDQHEREKTLLPIRALCSNNLPELVAALDYDPYPREWKLRNNLSWLPGGLRGWLISNGPLADRRHKHIVTATAALAVLDDEAAPAIPRLEILTRSTNDTISMAAFNMLVCIGTNGPPRLLAAMADETHPQRLLTIESFDAFWFRFTKEVRTSAVPVLVRCLQSTNSRIARAAASTLGTLKTDPAKSVPALIDALQNPDTETRKSVIFALGPFDATAGPAVPALLNACLDTNRDVRYEATNTLRRIRLATEEAATKAR